MKPLLDGCPVPLLTRHDGVLLDLDGVLYTGLRAVPGAARSVERIRAGGAGVAFVTNNASRTPEAVAAHLEQIGIPAAPADVVTSAQAAATAVLDLVGPGAPVLVVGGYGLTVALTERGLRAVRDMSDGPVAVVQGFAPDLSWGQLAQGTYAVRSGLPWIASNLDITVPTGEGDAPGNGALVEVIAMATGRRPVVVGKPEPALHAEAVRRTGMRSPVVVGDRLDTDIEGANRVGVPSLLVLTGVTTEADLLRAPRHQRPTFVAMDLAGLLEPHPPVTDTGSGGRSCGGWRCRVEGTGSLLAGRGEVLDGLRAACAAVWDHEERTGRAVADRFVDEVVARLASSAAGPARDLVVG